MYSEGQSLRRLTCVESKRSDGGVVREHKTYVKEKFIETPNNYNLTYVHKVKS